MEFYRGDGKKPDAEQKIRTASLTPEMFVAQTAPDRYRLKADESGPDADMRVVRGVNTALAMRMPLLVSGEPGSGKTQLGFAIAHELGKPKPFKFVTKSTSIGRDLFYSYDAIRHFQAAQTKGETAAVNADPRDFIEYAPLGLAVLMGMPLSQRTHFLSRQFLNEDRPYAMTPERRRVRDLLASAEARQCVVIIDEIDKAPRDFPNDLLAEIESMSFRIPELDGVETPALDDHLRPIVVITTNSERQLPDAFLRRCAFVHLDYPRGEALEAILAARLDGLFAVGVPFVRDVQAFYENLREQRILDKPPGTAELLQFLQAAAERRVNPELGIEAQEPIARDCVSLLGKTETDQDHIRRALANWTTKKT